MFKNYGVPVIPLKNASAKPYKMVTEECVPTPFLK